MQGSTPGRIPLNTGIGPANREAETATLPAIFSALLWYQELQRMKNQALQQSHSFETSVTLTLFELDWWSTKMNVVNGKSILAQELDLVMETNASMLGWRAVCDGIQEQEEPILLKMDNRTAVFYVNRMGALTPH